MNKTKAYHKEYLIDNFFNPRNFHYDKEETWKKGFKVHELPTI